MARFLEVALIVLVPWVIFTLIVGIFAYAMQDYSPLVWALAAACALLSLLFITMGFASGIGSYTAVGLLTLASVGGGVLVGLMLYNGYMETYWALDGGAIYRNLDPAEPALSHSDATQISFAEGSYVDVSRSVGYMRNGDVYCAAPILSSRTSSIEYWAVGLNCCDRTGGFTCGVNREGSAPLHGFVATRNAEHYRNAARMAQSVYGLMPPKRQGTGIFVHRTADIAGHMKSLRGDALSLLLIAAGVHLAVSCGAGFVLARVVK